MHEVLCASNNRKKVEELRSILEGLQGARVRTPRELGMQLEVEETGTSFAVNASIKAEAFLRAAGGLVVADDSGLVVDALDGAPGIYSARYAGPDASDEERCALVLSRLEGVPAEERTARFVCAIAVAQADYPIAVFEGLVDGYIAESARGRKGFGYDPIFFYPPLGCTFAELDGPVKASVSHRGRALRLAAALLRSRVEGSILD